MSPIDPRQDDPAELAALFLAGALEPSERRRVEEAFDAGDRALVEAMRRLSEGVLALGEIAGSVEPTPDVRMRVLAAAAASSSGGRDQIWREWQGDAAESGLFTLRGNDGSWEQTGVPGVEVRKLFVDRAANRMTAMFRMAPGTSYPEHHHDGHEECYVLHGDLHVGSELVMNAGDYQRAEAHSPHDRQWTEGGCVLLVSTSLSDEMHDEE
jgi:quercetin dioxygenase-like cupin family protein